MDGVFGPVVEAVGDEGGVLAGFGSEGEAEAEAGTGLKKEVSVCGAFVDGW